MSSWKSFLINLMEFILRPIVWGYFKLGSIRRIFYLSSVRSKCKNTVPQSTQFDGALNIVGSGNISIGKNCRFGREVTFETNRNGLIVIGDNVRINAGTFITSWGNVIIGDDTMIGEYVSIRDANHGVTRDKLIRNQPHNIANINIGKDVWIGRGSCILMGAEIGEGAVIGANSVVTKSVPGNMIYAGVPVREINTREKEKI